MNIGAKWRLWNIPFTIYSYISSAISSARSNSLTWNGDLVIIVNSDLVFKVIYISLASKSFSSCKVNHLKTSSLCPVPSTCLYEPDGNKARLASFLQLAQRVLFLPAASGFFYNADRSPVMHCSGNKIVVIVGKRAERPLPGWAAEMRWRAKAPSKARRQ